MFRVASLKWQYIAKILLSSVMLACGACATVMPNMDPPKVSFENIRSLPSEGGGPRFEITLRIANPNEQSLDIAGISYTMDLLDKEIISGVTNEVPLIEGYTEEVVTLEAGINLFDILRLVSGLGRNQSEDLEYRFRAKIDFRGLVPTQRIDESGTIALN
ncbi:MAG: LEA type 2 family protein [Halioglobus sp.]